MKTVTWIIIAVLSLGLLGCPSEKPGSTEGADAKTDESTDTNHAEQLPEDVQKKLKSLGYVQ